MALLPPKGLRVSKHLQFDCTSQVLAETSSCQNCFWSGLGTWANLSRFLRNHWFFLPYQAWKGTLSKCPNRFAKLAQHLAQSLRGSCAKFGFRRLEPPLGNHPQTKTKEMQHINSCYYKMYLRTNLGPTLRKPCAIKVSSRLKVLKYRPSKIQDLVFLGPQLTCTYRGFLFGAKSILIS